MSHPAAYPGPVYHDLAMRTAASALHPEKIDISELYAGMATIVALAAGLDLLKKGLIYGKDITGGDVAAAIDTKTEDFPEEAPALNLDAVPADVTHAVLGIVTEAGELAEAWLRAVLGPDGLDRVNMAEESGDLDWYQELLARGTGIPVDVSRLRNIAKLAKRYGDRYSDQAALTRDLSAERTILEGDAA